MKDEWSEGIHDWRKPKMIYSRRQVLSLVIFLLSEVTLAQDPCLDGNFREIDNVAKRSPSYDEDSTLPCDMYLIEGWYGSKTHVMSTSPPLLQKCGTTYPVWLKDPTPPDGIIQNLTACQVGFSDECSNAFKIEVKNCTGFLVYKLKPLSSCTSAYCFELDDSCVNKTVNNIRVSFHNLTWTEKEKENSPGVFQYDPSVNLVCSFTPSDDDSLLYHIDWYVDNETVIQGQTVDKSSLNNAILSAADLNKAGKKINSWIHCMVGIKASKNKFPCVTKSSKLFFAGIELLNRTVTIERKGTVTLMLRPTIPFASETIQRQDGMQSTSPLNIQLSFPGNTEAKCQQSTSGSLRKCAVPIESFKYGERQRYKDKTNWNKIYTMEISNSDNDGYYMQDHKLVLRLETNSPNGDGAQIFSDAVFRDVHINVVDKEEAWKGKRCSSYADPHQTTFDGYKYECQATGCETKKTYIFYSNDFHLQEVQVRHSICWSTARCVCAVAARSGQDVFTIDVCNQRQFINFPICNENSLKVIKETDKVYKIIFPTGTYVKVFIFNYGSSSWYLNVEVYPTVSDVDRTSGLCGVLDNDRTNDLRRRDGTQGNTKSYSYSYPPDDFSLSWQLPEGSNEDLLSMSQTVFDQLTPLSSYFHKLCTCDKEKTYCSYKQYTECKTGIKGKEFHCVLHSSSRRKRDLNFLTQIPGNINKNMEEEPRVKRAAYSEVDAYRICKSAFEMSTYYGTCLNVVPNFNNETLVNCMNDLVMTGNPNLTQLHLDTALAQCQTYILLNSTLEREQPDVTKVIVNLCPNNCSNKGVCSSGNCTCDYGFGGSDCSFDVLSPPTINKLSGDGVCDKSSEPCEDSTFYGHYFSENMGTTCHMTREEIDENNTVTSQTSYTVELQERTLYEGFCSLEYGPGSTFYTTFHFNMSNDGTQFSPLYTVYVYQSACQTFQNISGNIKVTLQNGYCYINGTCVRSGTFKKKESCWRCLSASNVYDWTWDCKEAETTTTRSRSNDEKTNKQNTKDEDVSPVGKILIASNVIVAAAICVVIGCIIKQKYYNKKSDDHSVLVAPNKDEVNIYPDSDRLMATRGNFHPADLFQFDSPAEKFSRPPSATSTRQLPSTNDFMTLYDKKHLDKLFGVNGH